MEKGDIPTFLTEDGT